jgi:hypothetical protein
MTGRSVLTVEDSDYAEELDEDANSSHGDSDRGDQGDAGKCR